VPIDAIRFSAAPQRIIIALPTWVGDLVMATPTLRAIRDRFREGKITFLAVPNLCELIDGGDWMDRVIEWSDGSKKRSVLGFLRLARRLRRESFDLAILLPNSFRSALLMTLAGVDRRVGYDRDGRGPLLTDRLDVPRVDGEIQPHPICDYYGAIAAALGCPPPGDRLELFTTPQQETAITQKLTARGLADRRPLVVITPGASFGASKLWLPERFAEVADRLHDEMNAAVVVTCGPREESIARHIQQCARTDIGVFDDPRLTLGELKALIKRCDLLLCNDTGPRHVAKAFNIPVVTVFGPTHQAWTDTNYADERKVSIPVDCGPCQQKTCPLGHHKCMTGVTADMVFDRCVELI